jgi:hypothetical protein
MKKIFGAALLAACLGFVGCDAEGPAIIDDGTPDTAVPGESGMPEHSDPAGYGLEQDAAPVDDIQDEAAPVDETLPE